MSLRTNLRSYLGLESIDVDINIGQAGSQSELDHPMVSAVASSGAMTPEAAEVEVQESAAEVEVSAAEAEEIEEDVSALESYYNILERSLDNNGINTVSAEMLNVGLDKILAKYNIKATEIVPAMEDYSNNAYSTTRVSMEKVGETISSMKTAAVEALKKLLKSIADFFRNISIKLIPAIKMRLKMIKKHAVSYKPKGGVKIKLTGKTADIIAMTNNNTVVAYNEFTSNAAKTATVLYNGALEFVQDKAPKGTGQEVVNKMFGDIATVGLLYNSSQNGDSYVKDAKIGGGTHVVTVGSQPSIKFNVPVEGREPVNELETPSLNEADIIKIIDKTLKLIETMEIYNKQFTHRSKLTNWVESLREEDAVKEDNKLITTGIKALSLGFKSLADYVFIVIKALTEYCAKSVKATEQKDKKEDKSASATEATDDEKKNSNGS